MDAIACLPGAPHQGVRNHPQVRASVNIEATGILAPIEDLVK
jgi:hypothetical protein